METPNSCRVVSPTKPRAVASNPQVVVSSNSPRVNINATERTAFIPIAAVEDNTSQSHLDDASDGGRQRPQTVVPIRSHDTSVISGITTKSSMMTHLGGSIDHPVDPFIDYTSSEESMLAYRIPQATSIRRNSGVAHTDFQAYLRATNATAPTMADDEVKSRQSGHTTASPHEKGRPLAESTLVVVTESRRRRILLNHQTRSNLTTTADVDGNMIVNNSHYSSFQQPTSPADKTPAHAAIRNLVSSTSIRIPIDVMHGGSVGKMHLTYTDETTEKVESELIHLYHIDLITAFAATTVNEDLNTSASKKRRVRDSTYTDEKRIRRPTDIAGMALEWIDDWDRLPLDRMHCTDTIWLPTLLEGLEDTKYRVTFDAWFQCAVPLSNSIGSLHENQYGYYGNSNLCSIAILRHSFLSMTDQNDDDNAPEGSLSGDAIKDHILYGTPLTATTTPVKKPYVVIPEPAKLNSSPRRSVDNPQQPFVMAVHTSSPNIAPTSETTNRTIANNNASPVKITLEQRLFHAIHNSKRNRTLSSLPPKHKLSIKEFKEAWAFANAVRSFYNFDSIDLVLDIAGGHGALAALFLVLTNAKRAVVVDPADVGNGSVQESWGEFFNGKSLEYRYECLRTGLRAELDKVLIKGGAGSGVNPQRILVVACHACQHLTDETLEIACSYGVHVTCMPCCQKDVTDGSSFKAFAKQAGIGIDLMMDLLTAGKVMSWNNGMDAGVKYQVRMKTIDRQITPQNRLILCKAMGLQENDSEARRVHIAHNRLKTAYSKAHGHNKHREHGDSHNSDRYTTEEHREHGVCLSIMKFVKKTLKKTSRAGSSIIDVATEECMNISKSVQKVSASISDVMLWKNLPLSSLLKLTKRTTNKQSKDLGEKEISDVGNPIHGLEAVKRIQDALSFETVTTAGTFLVGSILSLVLSPTSSQNR